MADAVRPRKNTPRKCGRGKWRSGHEESGSSCPRTQRRKRERRGKGIRHYDAGTAPGDRPEIWSAQITPVPMRIAHDTGSGEEWAFVRRGEMKLEKLWECVYANDRREHKHRCR